MAFLNKKRLWKTQDGKIVEDGDPRARFLFATPGMELNEKPQIEKPLGKKSLEPSEDKALKPDEDKGK